MGSFVADYESKSKIEPPKGWMQYGSHALGIACLVAYVAYNTNEPMSFVGVASASVPFIVGGAVARRAGWPGGYFNATAGALTKPQNIAKITVAALTVLSTQIKLLAVDPNQNL
jgi:hypothetical protein